MVQGYWTTVPREKGGEPVMLEDPCGHEKVAEQAWEQVLNQYHPYHILAYKG